MTDGILTLDFGCDERRLKVTFFEGQEKTLRPYEIHEPDWAQIEESCREILAVFRRSNQSFEPGPDVFNGLKKSGHLLFDLLIPAKAKEKLAQTTAKILTLRLDDTLVHIPWELLYDGREFLCRRFATGRIASTRQTPSADSIRTPAAPFRVLVVADPRGDLEACYREGMEIKTFLDAKRNVFHVDFKSHPVDVSFVKKNLRDYDIVHYAGHAKYDVRKPAESGWLLSDGTLKVGEIAAMGGFQLMPALVFCNACQSGRSDGWRADDSEQQIFGLANAFLLSGVQHYIGTFCETADEPSSHFAMRFYAAIAEGKTIGRSLRDARQSPVGAGQKETLAWANYMLYGDPGREYRGAESNLGRWKRVLQPSDLSINLRSRPILISLVGVAVLTLGYGAYSRYDLGTSMSGAAPAAQSAVSVATVAQPVVTTPLSLSMNIIGQRREPDGSYTEIIVREGSVLQSRDNFQVHVEANKRSHVYILLFDSQGQATQLFPDPKIEQQGFFEAQRRIAIPDKDLWFWLDEHPGTETVYVLASEEPMTDIREILRNMDKASEAERKRLSGDIKQRIKIVERGIGGVVKGKTVSYSLSDGKTIQKVTDVIAGSGAVVRAISFEHR